MTRAAAHKAATIAELRERHLRNGSLDERRPGKLLHDGVGRDRVAAARVAARGLLLHERVVILTAQIEDVPYVADDERASVRALAGNFFTLLVRYGFMETPDIPSMLAKCRSSLELDPMETSFFLGRETLIPRRRTDMAMWREKLFIRLARNALSAVEFFKIPPGRVVELGTQVEL